MAVLENKHILITRPAHQAATIKQLCETAGAKVSLLPAIEIQPIDDQAIVSRQLEQLRAADIVIFISANAVRYAMEIELGFDSAQPSGRSTKTRLIAAVGKKTAQTLQQFGLNADIIPQQGFRSEDLLALPAMQAAVVQDKTILIVRGGDGRELLAQTLTQRGALVQYADVYQRVCPPQESADALKQQLRATRIDIILLTSSESLHNLLILLDGVPHLHQINLLAGSQRIAMDARAAGFQADILIADNPGDEAMFATLLGWQQGTQHDSQTK